MTHALQLAERGRGYVEPNPMVGCLIVREQRIVGRGWHQQFGGPHAEIHALAEAGEAARGATAYVTLEPCSHQGKTGPCTTALIDAGVSRVVIGSRDPNPLVADRGIAALEAASIKVRENVLAERAERLIAPFRKLVVEGRPWVIAKWAMTLDGKLATSTGSSQWISGYSSRAQVHRIRATVDAILVGRGTVEKDDPLLTARPAGPRQAVRVVVDTNARLAIESQLVKTAVDVPVLVGVAESAPANRCQLLREHGVEVLPLGGRTESERLENLLDELGSRQMTNLLVEGGSQLLGCLFDLKQIDEVHAFVASKLVGGKESFSPIGGMGIDRMPAAVALRNVTVEQLGEDLHLHGEPGYPC